MGFNNGYDAGWQDAINAVKYGKVPGLGPASGGGGAAPAPAPTFDAGVLEGYDVEKLLSADDIEDYLDSLTDAQIKGLVVDDTTNNINAIYDSARNFLDPVYNRGLAKVLRQILDEAYSREILDSSM